MNFSMILIFLVSLCAQPVWAIRHVGNGGGITEQNLVFAFENMNDLLTGCKLGCDLSMTESQIMNEFLVLVKNPQHSLYFFQKECSQHDVQEFNWQICVPKLSYYDINEDDFLDLSEAVLFFLDLHLKSKKFNGSNNLTDEVQKFLQNQTYQFLFSFSGNLEFQFFGFYSDHEVKNILFLQRPDQNPIRLDTQLLKNNECQNVHWMQPYFTEHEQIDQTHSVVMVFPYLSLCDSKAMGKINTRTLQILFHKTETLIY